MRRWLRILRLALHVARGLFIAALFFPFQSAAAHEREIRAWSQRLLSILAVRLEVHGGLAQSRPLMLVGNHVSWVDIFLIDSLLPVRFVAKLEVRGWPLVGWLSARCGTLFVDQTRPRDAMRINALVTTALRSGEVFAVFPEGTTTDGSRLLKFHGSLIEPAVQAEAAVQPFAVRYERADGSLCTEAAFDATRSVWDTVIDMTRLDAITAHLWFLEPIASAGRHRREITAEACEAISRSLFPQDSSSRTAPASDLRAAVR